MILRRNVVMALGAGLLAPLASFAQQTQKVWRIGFMGAGSASDVAGRVEALRMGLRERGYTEGKNLVIEYRWAEGKAERFAINATELVRLNADLLVTHTVPGALAARQATTTIPIVVAAFDNPIAAGITTSLARPEGNLTGGIFFTEEIGVKRIALLKETAPRITRVAALWAGSDLRTIQRQVDLIDASKKNLNVAVPRFSIQEMSEIEGVFAALVKQGITAVTLFDNPLLVDNAKFIAELAIKHRLMTSGPPPNARAGGLIGYGASIDKMFYRAAYFIDRIFKGAKPGELPIEQATTFDMIVNMKTAKALGIKIPDSIMVQATKVIE